VDVIELKDLKEDENGFLHPGSFCVSKEGNPWVIGVVCHTRSGGWDLNVYRAKNKKWDRAVTDIFREEFCTYCLDRELFEAGFEYLSPTPPKTLWEFLLLED
jgi:hypothetical protein